MTFFRHLGKLLHKELRLEWRRPSRTSGVFFFALALVLMVAFASPSEGALRDHAGGVIWIGLLLASTRALDQSYASDLADRALQEMVLWPVDGRAIFYAKSLANTLMLALVAAALTPLVIGVYDAKMAGDPKLIALFLLAGSAAIAAPGTLLGLMTSQIRGSSVLLPLLLFPLVVPALLASARGTTLVMEGDPMGQASSWLLLLGGFIALHWSVSALLYERILEDS